MTFNREQMMHDEWLEADGAQRIVNFEREPWPRWTFGLEDGTKIEQEIFAVNSASLAALSWRSRDRKDKATLTVWPFLSGRDCHSLHLENPAFQFQTETNEQRLLWHPYPDIPKIIALHNGAYRHRPDWRRNFIYAQERERGLDFTEDLAAPGDFQFDLKAGPAIPIFAGGGLPSAPIEGAQAEAIVDAVERGLWTALGLRFLAPLLQHFDCAALGHVSEIVDAEAQHIPRGCPFQVWSLAELIRLDPTMLAPNTFLHAAQRSAAL